MANTKVTSAVIEAGAILNTHIASGAISSGHLSGINTGAVAEGSNLYYTDARAQTRARASISVTGGNLAYDSSTGVLQLTDNEIRDAISAGGNLSYNNSTGVMSYTTPTMYTDADAQGAITVTDAGGDGSLAYSGGTITYTGPSAAEVRAHLSAGNALSYSSGQFAVVAPTASGGTNTTALATTAFVQQEITTLIGGAPSTLNDLNELAAAINDDANYNTTLTTALATKLPLAGGTMTGNLTIDKEDPNINLSDTSSSRTLAMFVDNNNSVVRASGPLLLQVGSTSAITIDASRNTVLAGTLGSGAITTSSTLSSTINGNNASGGNIVLGALSGASKWFAITGRQYDNTTETEGYSLITGASSTGVNNVTIGGGLDEQNAATSVNIKVAANSTTRNGTEVVRVTTSGLDVRSNNIRITGTTVIDSSRNITAAAITVGGTLGVGAGTESLPSLSFAGDTNTGIYSLAADNLGFSIGGTRKGFWSGTQFNVTGNGIFSGNGTFGGTLGVTGTVNGLTLGAGNITGSDSANFTLNTANSVRINIDSNNSATGESFIVGNNQTAINQSNVLFKVQENGYVGIGVVPTHHFNLQGTGTVEARFRSTDGDMSLQISSDADETHNSELVFVSGTSGRGSIVYDHNTTAASQKMLFKTGDTNVTAMTILGDGNVGIGDSAPQDFLEVKGTSLGGITISNSNHNQAALSFARSSTATARIFTSEPAALHTSAMHFQTSTAASGPTLVTAMTIDQSQNVGIGVTPSTGWVSSTDFTALQIGSGLALWGRGSGDHERLGLTANLYHDGSAWKHLNTGRVTAYEQNDGKHIFNYYASQAAGTSVTPTTAMVIDTSGKVAINHGLGGGAINSQFNVFADGEAIRIDGTANASRTLRFRNAATNGSGNAIITSDGILQIRTEDANAHIYMNSVRDIAMQTTSLNGTAGHFTFSSYNTEIMRIDGANNYVGIGTPNPAASLDINGAVTIRNANYLYFGQSNDSLGTWTTRQYASGSSHQFNAQSFSFNRTGYASDELLYMNSDGIYPSTINHGHSRMNGLSTTSLAPSADDWVDIATIPYGRNTAKVKLLWDGVSAPSSAHHGLMEFQIGSHYGTSYYYGWDSYINLLSSSAHNSFYIKEARIITPNGSGATGVFQVKWALASTVGVWRVYITEKDESCTIAPITPVVNNSRSGTTIAELKLGDNGGFINNRVSLATSRDMHIGGGLTIATQPSAMAHKSGHHMETSGINNVTGWSTQHSVGGDFNASTGVFTCPTAGRYLCTFSPMSGQTTGDVQFRILRNSALLLGSNSMAQGGGPWRQTTVTGVIDCDAGDTLRPAAYSSVTNAAIHQVYTGSYSTLSFHFLG